MCGSRRRTGAPTCASCTSSAWARGRTRTWVVQRLLYALYAPSHLFLIHLDVKATETAVAECFKLELSYANVHVLCTRRLVVGMFSMVVPMLDAIKAALDSFDQRDDTFDYLINLSDADLALSTDAEVRPFLARIRPRSMITVHDGGGPQLKEANDFINNYTVVEGGGYGFVAANRTADTFALTFGCAPAARGPRLRRPRSRRTNCSHTKARASPTQCTRARSGPSSRSTSAATCSPGRDRAARRLRATTVPDESFLQTTVMHRCSGTSSSTTTCGGSIGPTPTAIPTSTGPRSGWPPPSEFPKALNASELAAVFGSLYMFARRPRSRPQRAAGGTRGWPPSRRAAAPRRRRLPGHSPGDPDCRSGSGRPA